MDEEKYAEAMQIIMHAGGAKSAAMLAIDAAASGDFEAAERQLAEAKAEMAGAHKAQFGLVHAEASGEEVDLSVILVHAQDHLTMAIMAIDFAGKFVELYRRLDDRLATE